MELTDADRATQESLRNSVTQRSAIYSKCIQYCDDILYDRPNKLKIPQLRIIQGFFEIVCPEYKEVRVNMKKNIPGITDEQIMMFIYQSQLAPRNLH
jgi:hypothetical protein